MMAPLAVTSLSLRYGATQILDGINLDLPKGQITAIVGPNACGKSSLLRCMARLQRPSGGDVLLDGQPIERLNTRAVARQLAFLPQSAMAPTGMKVMDLVLRGRTSHQSPFQQYSAKDQAVVTQALDHVGLQHRGDAYLSDLSGGQLQRAWIAIAA
jgi:iron complex transport system ATP-binding protein